MVVAAVWSGSASFVEVVDAMPEEARVTRIDGSSMPRPLMQLKAARGAWYRASGCAGAAGGGGVFHWRSSEMFEKLAQSKGSKR